ncbi:hypothetical protein EV424DRAFT_1341156 [Suillus variegatus]|nr:hypothetical protein EV424DRAFT_1557793 [Suillus variegatus]KAG1834833.1 hypothetical protein EV424DRAFT_1341156 [Suillus variegatus]
MVLGHVNVVMSNLTFAIPDDTSDHAGAATYLLEERIEGKFIKYINNNSAVPTYHLRGFEEKIGLFLCFAQHVQHRLTNEVVYLSDFQGSGNLLTDCQVMTGPEYSAKFGEGNCTEAFHAFKSTHKCNFYCRAFAYKCQTYAASSAQPGFIQRGNRNETGYSAPSISLQRHPEYILRTIESAGGGRTEFILPRCILVVKSDGYPSLLNTITLPSANSSIGTEGDDDERGSGEVFMLRQDKV